MNKIFSMPIAGLIAGTALLLCASFARADGRVNWSLNVGVPIAQPVYVQPAPVYVQPAPIYVQPAPVYVRPAPVMQIRSYAPLPIVVEEDYYYRGGPRWHHGRGGHHGHDDHGGHRGHDDHDEHGEHRGGHGRH